MSLDFPKPNLSLLQLIGPSIVLIALSISGGELLLWPELISKYGFFIMWLIPITLLLQYYVNLEIERYTIVTSKTALNGIIDFYKPLKFVFVIAIIISLAWPAWITTSGFILSNLIGSTSYSPYISIILLICTLFIWNNKTSYLLIEKSSKIAIGTIFLLSLIVVLNLIFFGDIGLYFERVNFFVNPNDSFAYASALAFGGVVGVLNLIQSNWVKTRKYGINQLNSNEIEKVSLNSLESQANYKKWWKLITLEHFFIYYIGNIFGFIIIGLVALITLFDSNVKSANILIYQVEYINNILNPLGYLWAFAVIIIFLMAQITILEAAGGLTKDTLKSQKSQNYFSRVFGVIGIAILLIGLVLNNFSQPAFLLQLSALFSAATMVIYPPLLLIINNKFNEIQRPKLINKIMVSSCSIFYLIVLIVSVYYELGLKF
jgi:hypothetical protein